MRKATRRARQEHRHGKETSIEKAERLRQRREKRAQERRERDR